VVVDVPLSPMPVKSFLIMKIIDDSVMCHAHIETIPHGVVYGTMDGVWCSLLNQVIPNDVFVTGYLFKPNFHKLVNDRNQSLS